MGYKKASKSIKAKRNIVKTTIEIKKDHMKHKNGVCMPYLALEFGLVKSSICTNLKNKKTIKNGNYA